MGSVFQRRYRNRKGESVLTKTYTIQYLVSGRVKRESTPFTKKKEAIDFLKQRLSDLQAGRVSIRANVTFEDLSKLIVTDYKNNGRKNLYNLEKSIIPKLTDGFGGLMATDIRTAHVEEYKSGRLLAGAAPATINRELAALKRMFRLGIRLEKVTRCRTSACWPSITCGRAFLSGTSSHVLGHLPEYCRALFEVAYITGWRVESELLTRQWSNVQFTGAGCLRIEPGEAKDMLRDGSFLSLRGYGTPFSDSVIGWKRSRSVRRGSSRGCFAARRETTHRIQRTVE